MRLHTKLFWPIVSQNKADEMNALGLASSFDEQMTRIQLVTGTRTQIELADLLGIRQSSISDAKRRGKIPADWLITIMRTKDVHPEWILTGNGPCYVLDPTPEGHYETGETVQERRAKEEALRQLSSKSLSDELLRRIAVSQADRFTRSVPACSIYKQSTMASSKDRRTMNSYSVNDFHDKADEILEQIAKSGLPTALTYDGEKVAILQSYSVWKKNHDALAMLKLLLASERGTPQSHGIDFDDVMDTVEAMIESHRKESFEAD